MEARARFLNVGQAATYLGVSAASLRTWSNRGLVPTYRTPGGQRRYDTEDLDAFMRSMREPVGPEVEISAASAEDAPEGADEVGERAEDRGEPVAAQPQGAGERD